MPHGGYGVLAHHNSHDTPDTVDPKSLRDMMVMNAAYTYFLAAAGPAEKRWMAEVTLTRGYQQVAAAADKILDQIAVAENADRLARLLYQGRESIDYVLNRESKAVRAAWDLSGGLAGLSAFAKQQTERIDQSARNAPRRWESGTSPRSRRRATPKRRKSSSAASAWNHHARQSAPRAARKLSRCVVLGVPVSALYWCDGKRSLAE